MRRSIRRSAPPTAPPSASFAGGEIVTGGVTVILAMGAGRRAARAIGAWLQHGKQRWPISAEDAAVFVPPVPLSPDNGTVIAAAAE